MLPSSTTRMSLSGSKARCWPSVAELKFVVVADADAGGSTAKRAMARTIVRRMRALPGTARRPSRNLSADGRGVNGSGSGGPEGRGDSEVPGHVGPVGIALFEERVPALGRLVGHVRQARRLAREELLADQAVVDQVERVLQH